jgi:hypothetical protein
MIDTPATDSTQQSPACCGVKYPFWQGRTPLPDGCQLCPNSPTYWRKPADSSPPTEGAA